MIKTFRDRDTEALFLTGKSRRLPQDIRRTGLSDLRGEGRKLESYGGDVYTIRINDRYRLFFRWTGSGAEDVEIRDPH